MFYNSFPFQLKHVKEKSVNFITRTSEPRVPFWSRKVPGVLCSASVVILMVTLVMVAVFGVILYRMSMNVALSLVNQVRTPRISYSYSRLALDSVSQIEELKKSKLIAGDDKKQRQPVHICYRRLHQFGGHFGGESNLRLCGRLADGD